MNKLTGKEKLVLWTVLCEYKVTTKENYDRRVWNERQIMRFATEKFTVEEVIQYFVDNGLATGEEDFIIMSRR